MSKNSTLSGLTAAALIGVLALASAAEAREYLTKKIHPRDPVSVEADDGGDSPVDYLPGYNDPESVAGKEARVRAYVQQQLEMYQRGEGAPDGHRAQTSQDFNALVAEANSGEAKAIYRVGQALERGLGTSRNVSAALDWYKRAAEINYPPAFSAIGDIYRENHAEASGGGFFDKIKNRFSSNSNDSGIVKDDVEARAWYQKGIALRDSRSFKAMSEFYQQGLGGVKADPKYAKLYENHSLKAAEEAKARDLRRKEYRLLQEARAREGIFVLEGADIPMKALQADGSYEITNSVDLPTGSCTYGKTDEKRDGYFKLYSLNCPATVAVQNIAGTVWAAGMDCKVSPSQAEGKPNLLLCNPKPEIFKMSGVDCSVQPTGRANNADESFRLYCGGVTGQASRARINYLGMQCTVQPYNPNGNAKEPSYDLFCQKAYASKRKKLTW